MLEKYTDYIKWGCQPKQTRNGRLICISSIEFFELCDTTKVKSHLSLLKD